MLDTLFKGSKKGTVRSSNYAGGHGGPNAGLPRPQSESDFTEIEEQEFMIEHLDDDGVNDHFEKMLDNLNLTEEKKQPLRNQPMMNKRQMLKMQYKGTTLKSDEKFHSASDYIEYLQHPDLSVAKLHSCVQSLRIALTNKTLNFVQEFGNNGLKALLNQLKTCNTREGKMERVQYECLRCLKAIMNNTFGLKQILGHKEALKQVAIALNPLRQTAMLEACKIMAAVCLLPDGHDKALEAITSAVDGEDRDRFTPIVRGLILKSNEQLRIGCMTLINALVTSAMDLDFRVHLRNEMMRAGLGELLVPLQRDAGDELALQMKIFMDHKEEDYDELLQKFDHLRLDMEDSNECFEFVKNLTSDTPAEPYFLSILQHLLFIRDDPMIRPAYFKLIEECVTQIVLHKSGCDPDFSATKRFQIDVEPLIEGLVEKSKAEDERAKEALNAKLEEALALKQEAEARLQVAEQKLKEMISTGVIPTSGVGKLSGPPPPPIPGMIANPGGPPPPPLMPGMPPPPPGMMGPPPPPMPGMGPRPPPMPGMGGPPMPPPPPGMGPPPPPGMAMGPPRAPDVLPYGLKPKRKWDVGGPLKRANWKAIVPQKMSEKAFWIQVREEKLASPDILEGLAQKFSSKPISKKSDDNIEKQPNKKIKDLKVLDGKAAQNLSILLGGSLKHLSYEDVKRCILRCDIESLPDSVLQQLISYLPPPDQLKKLQEFKSQYNELTEAEQFAVTISEIKRLLPRLKSMSFRLHQSEMVQDVKPDIVAGTAACEEIKTSQRFARILELILLMGNYMNSGSRNEAAFGFEISFLPKLSSTKDIENKSTLMHYLAETVEKKFPDLLALSEELAHIDRAARVSVDTIGKTLRTMDTSIRNLETDLTNSKVPQNADDKFYDVMSEFAKEARQQCDLLTNMFKNMTSLYKELSEFYAFDVAKYTFEEFYTDIKSFKDSFLAAHKENVKVRETEEKAERARQARDKQERERAERMAHKRALVDMNGAEEGVMDSLLEALQTGSAFTREQRRKRAPRAAGAERRAQLSRSRSRTGLATNALTGRELGELLAA
ncbi:protein diaphanous isoform X2 [Neocloeon triangulifer]|uniref:protein diaphanous isoform X2 n=1 Tax=Neocloeon triangulifer TaxID=2078957 RepID=UPI00286EE15D|nr:protein diaphanous isoform X2 [Neocloeon triangulifer]